MGNTNSGRGGLPYAKRREVERLIESGRLKNAQIARVCGIDVSTVSRYKRRIKLQSQYGEEPMEEPNTMRCGSCGGLLLATEEYCRACFQEAVFFRPARLVRINRRRK